MYIRTLIDGLGVYMWQYCIQTCDGSPESQKLRDTLWTQTHWSLNQWQISHDFAGMLHLKWPSFCLKYARTLHEMWFIQWRVFLFMWRDSSCWMTYSRWHLQLACGCTRFVLCTRLHNRRLSGASRSQRGLSAADWYVPSGGRSEDHPEL